MAHPGVPRPELVLRIHVRILAEPLHFTIEEMVDAARRVYATAGVQIEVGSTAWIDDFDVVRVGRCAQGELTVDQRRLFIRREGVPPGDVVVYFMRALVPDMNGCASHPDDQPGALIAATATRWTLAHELGHVLGLGHVEQRERLMTGWGKEGFGAAAPLLTPGEIALLRTSSVLQSARRV